MITVEISGKSWTLTRGEQWVVSGPVASGKTWLAYQLATYWPDTVAIVTFGQQASSGGDWQAARYHASLNYDIRTVEETLSYESVNDINPFEVRPRETKRRAAFKKLRQWVEQALHLTPLLDNLTIQLSNGEQRRLLLACAILRQTPILVLDDPFAGLDSAMQQMLRTLFGELVQRGLTLVVTVRNEDEIPPTTTHRLRLKNRKIVSQEAFTPPTTETTPLTFTHKNPPSLKTPEILAIHDLSYAIGGKTLFDAFNWTVHQGERWLIIGPNGSGKTTLMSLITGDNPRSYAFDIQRFGRSLGPGTPLWSVRSRIASVSPEQQVCLDSTLTVINATLSGIIDSEGRRHRPTSTQRKAAEQWLTLLGLHEEAHATLGTLSAGRCRLVLIARALMANPDLLLLDELCMNLETAERKRLLLLLDRLLRATPTLTTLCIAHRQDHVPPHFDRVLRLGV
ncbi:MAG: ATP-binding cassette domain-containing protein [Kiritimatiellia bacterium]